MITIKLLGGARKSFATDKIELNIDNGTIEDIINHLVKNKPKDTPELDIKNTLIAINGVDSSALQGRSTQISHNDTVSIIPIIHGGSNRIKIKIGKQLAELFRIKPAKNLDNSFLDSLRSKHSHLIIQGISSKFILNPNHAKKIIMLSLESKKNNTLLSNKIETDILMRFACSTQISAAINRVGISPGKPFYLISIGTKTNLDKLYNDLKCYLYDSSKLINNETFLKKEFKISQKHLHSILSDSPLEDLLVEKAAVLF